MLRDVLTLLIQAGVWQHMPRAASQNVVLSIVDLACSQYDCNAGEILDGHEELGICYSCWKPVEQLRHGLCQSCWSADGDSS